MDKGTFTLRPDYKVPTNVTMYCCVDCKKNGVTHAIIEKPGPAAPGNEVSFKGSPTTIREVLDAANKMALGFRPPW